MGKTTIHQLHDYGQSIWLDYISRPMIISGKLNDWIDKGICGVTSNPAIFNQAISKSDAYDEKISELKSEGKSLFEIYDALTIADIQNAADAFLKVYETTDGVDGYVSLEINPLLANKIEEQVKEGMRLFRTLNRSNVMIKVPATKEGLVVIERLTAAGVNVNATLIFSCQQYIDTANAYIRGLKTLAETGHDLSKIRSVASVFVSRIDSVVDQLIDSKILKDSDKNEVLAKMKGKAAISNCRIIFEQSKAIFSSDRFNLLKEKNANIQRVLWASTSTKNPEYSDIKYITELVANNTVNTVPEKTLNAFLDHGRPEETGFTVSVEEAEQIISSLKLFDIDLDAICMDLLVKGVEAFDVAFKSLLASIESKTISCCPM